MGCRESKRERVGKGLGAKKNKGNQPTATRRGMEIIILLSPLLCLPPLASSSTPTLPLLHLSLRFRKFAFYIAHSPPPFPPLPKSPFSLLLFRRRRHLTASSKLG